jgi:hypothetical protein
VTTRRQVVCSVPHRPIRQRGQAGLEFLLILPLFFLMIFVCIDCGLAMYHYVTVANGVREAARYGAVNCGTGACTVTLVRDRAVERSGNLIGTGDVSARWVDRDSLGSNSTRGDSIVVSVSHPYNFLFVPGASITVQACADMRLEQMDMTTGLPSGSGC